MGGSRPRRIEERIAAEVWHAAVLLGLAVLQITMLPRQFGIPFNLMLVLVITHALTADTTRAARWAVYGGLGLDICTAGSLLGSHALALLLAVLAAGLPLTRVSRDNWLLPLAGAILGAFAYYSVIGIVTALSVAPIDAVQYARIAALPGTLSILIPALPLFLLMRRIESRRRGEVPIDIY